MLMVTMMPGMMAMIGALYGVPSAWAGWVAHLAHGAFFGLLWVLILRTPTVSDLATRPGLGAFAGMLYGVVIWAVAAAFVMPLWIGAVTPMEPPMPDFNLTSLMGHAVFGIVLGAGYALLARRGSQ